MDFDWHFGSDMARFELDTASDYAAGWCVCADLDAMRCDVMFLVVAAGHREDELERALAQVKVYGGPSILSLPLSNTANQSVPG